MRPDRKQIHAMFGGRCAYCGCLLLSESGKHMQVDHVKAVRRCEGKFKKPENSDVLYPACPQCNNYKSTMSIDTFRNELKMITDRIFDQSTSYRNALRFGMIKVKLWDGVFWFEKYKPRQKQ